MVKCILIKVEVGTNSSSTGRIRVRINSKWLQVSRLVALAWVKNPNPDIYDVVMHLDNNPENNYYKNLKWGTQSQNILQAYRDGNLKTPSALIARGEAHSNSSITNQTRNMIVDLRINYKVPESKLSIIFGISKRHINKIVSQYKSGILDGIITLSRLNETQKLLGLRISYYNIYIYII